MVFQVPSASGANILLFLPAGDDRRRLSEALDADHRVVLVDELMQAERAVETETPDLVVIGADLVGSEGTLDELGKRLRGDDTLLLLFGASDPELVARSLTLGYTEHIERPLLPVLAARRIGHLLDLRYSRELLHSHSLLDGLTGIANRGRFDTFYQAAFANAQRRKESIALILFDIDHFGAYNEALGHAAGDEALVHVGRTLSGTRRRPLDLFARYAGDRFVGVLPNTDLDGAYAVAEILLADIDALMIDHPRSDIANHLTISLGIAAQMPTLDDLAEELVVQAHDALERARDNGRHCISD